MTTATTVTLRVEAANGAHPSPATWLSRVGIWDDIYGDGYGYIYIAINWVIMGIYIYIVIASV